MLYLAWELDPEGGEDGPEELRGVFSHLERLHEFLAGQPDLPLRVEQCEADALRC